MTQLIPPKFHRVAPFFLENFGSAYPFVSRFWPDPALGAVILLCAMFIVKISSFYTLQVSFYIANCVALK